MIANADGSGQRLLAKRGGDEYFFQDAGGMGETT
jgi:hypothetical protein